MRRTTTDLVLILSALTLGLAVVVLLAYVFVEDEAVARFISFILTAVPIILGFAFMSDRQNQTDKNAEEAAERAKDAAKDTRFIASRVNGNLDRKFNEIHERLDVLDPNVVTTEEDSNGE